MRRSLLIPARWWTFVFMFAFALLGYVQRQTTTVAAERMMPELHFSQLQIGLLYWSFMVGYTLFQSAAGLAGQVAGARRTLAIAGVLSILAAVGTPVLPWLLSGTWLFAALLATNFLLGIAQAPIFPVSAGVLSAWFAPQRWSLVLGLQSMGMNLGTALTPPLVATLMQFAGWRSAVLVTALLPIPVVALWAWYGRDTPAERAGSPAEAPVHRDARHALIVALLRRREIILITASYLCMNYVFFLLSGWIFLYLIQEHHLTALQSGWLSMAPPLAAAVGAGLGGRVGTALCSRFGAQRGFKVLHLAALPLAALLLMLAVTLRDAYGAVAALAGAFAAVELIEGPIWAAMAHVAKQDTMPATGILNTGGNLGGVIGIPVVAYLSDHHQWTAAVLLGAAIATLGGILWLWIDTDRA